MTGCCSTLYGLSRIRVRLSSCRIHKKFCLRGFCRRPASESFRASQLEIMAAAAQKSPITDAQSDRPSDQCCPCQRLCDPPSSYPCTQTARCCKDACRHDTAAISIFCLAVSSAQDCKVQSHFAAHIQTDADKVRFALCLCACIAVAPTRADY